MKMPPTGAADRHCASRSMAVARGEFMRPTCSRTVMRCSPLAPRPRFSICGNWRLAPLPCDYGFGFLQVMGAGVPVTLKLQVPAFRHLEVGGVVGAFNDCGSRPAGLRVCGNHNLSGVSCIASEHPNGICARFTARVDVAFLLTIGISCGIPDGFTFIKCLGVPYPRGFCDALCVSHEVLKTLENAIKMDTGLVGGRRESAYMGIRLWDGGEHWWKRWSATCYTGHSRGFLWYWDLFPFKRDPEFVPFVFIDFGAGFSFSIGKRVTDNLNSRCPVIQQEPVILVDD